MRFTVTPFGCVCFDFFRGCKRPSVNCPCLRHISISILRWIATLRQDYHQKVGPLVGCTNQIARCIGSSRVFQLLQCGACFFGLRLRPRFQSLFGWSWPRKEHVKIYAHLSMDNSNLASKIRRLR